MCFFALSSQETCMRPELFENLSERFVLCATVSNVLMSTWDFAREILMLMVLPVHLTWCLPDSDVDGLACTPRFLHVTSPQAEKVYCDTLLDQQASSSMHMAPIFVVSMLYRLCEKCRKTYANTYFSILYSGNYAECDFMATESCFVAGIYYSCYVEAHRRSAMLRQLSGNFGWWNHVGRSHAGKRLT